MIVPQYLIWCYENNEGNPVFLEWGTRKTDWPEAVCDYVPTVCSVPRAAFSRLFPK